MLINFIDESIAAIYKSGHYINDVKFVSNYTNKSRISFNQFSKMFKHINYYNNYCKKPTINTNLIIMFKDGSGLRRKQSNHNYYNLESWQVMQSNLQLNDSVVNNHSVLNK